MANLNVNGNLFDQSFVLSKQNNTIITLSTSGTYANKDIQLTTNVRSATAVLSATASATITNLSYTYNNSGDNFVVSGSRAISGTASLAVTQSGWLDAGFFGSVNGTVAISGATIPTVEIGASITGTAKVTPTINRTNTGAAGATNIGSSAATTTAPASGYFVSVQSAGASNNITASPSVTETGYGTTEHFNATNASVQVGANDSAITYIPITSGVAAANTASADVALSSEDGTNGGRNIAGVIGTKATTEPNSGYYIAMTASGSGSSKITTAGWMPAGNLPTASTTSGIKYFPISTGTLEVTGGGLTASTGYSSLSSDGYYNGVTYDTNDKVDITSQTSLVEGYYKVTTSGYGKVNRAKIAKRIVSAGYFPADANPIDQMSEATGTSNTGTNSYYIKKSILSTDTVASSNSAQTVTVYAGYYPTNRTITITAMPTVTPTTNYANTGLSNYFTSGTSNDKDVSITPRYSNSAGYVAAHTNTNNGGTGYWKIIPSTATYTASSRTDSYDTLAGYCSSAQLAEYTQRAYGRYKISGNTYKLTDEQVEALSATSSGSQTIAVYRRSSSSVTRGNAKFSEGWLDEEHTITPAIFANIPSSGVSYLDLTESSAMPVLDSGGKLYINRGYVDNFVVDLGQFIPSEANVSSSEQMTSGASGINNEGDLIVGSLNLYDSSNLGASGATVYVPSNGYFLATASYTITSGNYQVSQTQLSPGTAGATVDINNQQTYGFTKTKPSAGTYVTISPVLNTTNWTISATAEITKAGYLAKGHQTTTYTGVISPVTGDTYYIPAVTPTFSGGGLSGSTTNTITTSMTTSTTATSYYIDATATGTATRAVVKYTNDAGVIAVHSGTTALSKAGRNMGSSASRVYIPAATITIDGGGLTATNKSATPTVSIGTGSNSNMSNITIGAINTATYAYFFRVYATSTSATMYPTVTRAATTDIRTAGYVPARASTNILGPATCTATATINAANAGTGTYVSIKAATIASEGSVTTAPSVTIGGTNTMAVSSTETPYYFTRTGSASAGTVQTKYKVTGAGYTPTKNATNSGTVSVTPTKTANATVYIKEANLTATGSVSTTPSVAISKNTNMTTATSATYYVTISGTATKGSTDVVYSASAGYTPAATASQSVEVTPSITGATTVYIPTAKINSSGSVPTVPSVTIGGSTNMVTSTSAVYYFTRTGTANKGSAKVIYSASAGYTPAATASRSVEVTPSFSGNGTVYIPTANLSSTGSVSTTPSVAINKTTNMTTSTSATYYVTLSGTATKGSTNVVYSANAGYTPAATASRSVEVTPSITGATTVYIPTASVRMSNISGGGVGCGLKSVSSCTATTTDTLNSGVSIQFSGSRAAASASCTATAGYTPATNSSKSLAAATANSSVYYLQSVTLAAPTTGVRAFDIIVPNGNTVDFITFRFEVDSAGNVTVGPPSA